MRRKSRRLTKPGELPCRFTAFFDGCCEPRNPGGTAGYGCVIFDRNTETLSPDNPRDAPTIFGARVYAFSGMIPAAPTTSNNVAEYLAINCIMNWLLSRGYHNETAHAWGDSRLVICQLWGWPLGSRKWKIHGVDTPGTRGFYVDSAVEARNKLKQLPKLLGFWIPREENSIADELSKAELKRVGVEFKIQPEA